MPPADPACEDVRFNCTLADVDAALAAGVVEGQILPVGLLDDRFPIVKVGSQKLGSVTSGQLRVLARCLREGEPFVADVLKVDGGWIDVLVRHG